MWSAARSAKISMILCMPERVSGGDAKFQGFCDGWNKWEGQARSARRWCTGDYKRTPIERELRRYLKATHRRAIRTTNLLERLFVEECRRLKIIPNAFAEKAVLKLMFGAMIRAAERWRAIRVSELERRQMRAVREDLDRECEAANGLGPKASAPARQAKISSTSRT